MTRQKNMSHTKQRAVKALNLTADILLVFLALTLLSEDSLSGFGLMSRVLYSTGVPLLLLSSGLYRSEGQNSLGRKLTKLTAACLAGAVLLALGRTVTDRAYSEPQVYGLVCVAASAALGVKVTLVELFSRHRRHAAMGQSGASPLFGLEDRQRLNGSFAALLFGQILYYLCRSMFPKINNSSALLAEAALILLSASVLWWAAGLRRADRSTRMGGWLLLSNALWVGLTRFLLDVSFDEGIVTCSFYLLFFCGFCCGGIISREQRRRILSTLTLGFCPVLLIWGLVGAYAVWTRQYIRNKWFLWGGIGLIKESQLVALRILFNHRNNSAFFYVIGIGLLLFQCRQSPKKRWRWMMAVCLPVFLLTLALQHSRSCWIAAGLCLSMNLGFLLQKRLHRLWTRTAALFLTAAFGTVIIFSCFNPLSNFFVTCSNLAQSTGTEDASLTQTEEALPAPETASPAVEAASNPTPASHSTTASHPTPTADQGSAEAEAPTEPPLTAEDVRDVLQDAKTLTLRTKIWAAVLPALEEDPSIALKGQQEKTMMNIINARLYYPVSHMHNMLLQQLMLSGVPSFLLYGIFTVWMGLRILVCLCTDCSADRKCLAALCAAALLYGMVEPLMSKYLPVSSLIIPLLFGCFSGETAAERASV